MITNAIATLPRKEEMDYIKKVLEEKFLNCHLTKLTLAQISSYGTNLLHDTFGYWNIELVASSVRHNVNIDFQQIKFNWVSYYS